VSPLVSKYLFKGGFVIRVLFLLSFLFAGTTSFASVDCPSAYPNGNTFTYSDGAMNYPNGNTFRYSNGAMNYPNGNTLRYSNGAMNYANGNTLRYSNGAMNYPNGNTLRYSNGQMNDANGNTNSTGSISLNTAFGDKEMRIVVRPTTAKFQTTLQYGSNGIVIVEFDEDGDVTCTVEGGSNQPREFRVEGNRGSAYVTVNPGQDAGAVKAAVQRALDGN
jgi:hypothetical protein